MEYLRNASANALNHTGKNGSSYAERVEAYCRWGGSLFEALDFAPRTSSRDLVVAWLVDDGDKKRSHRKQLFNDKFKYFGIASGPHLKLPIQCSIALFSA
jgi:uncharacterized protein YkwD